MKKSAFCIGFAFLLLLLSLALKGEGRICVTLWAVVWMQMATLHHQEEKKP